MSRLSEGQRAAARAVKAKRGDPKLRWTQEELAEVSGVSLRTIQDFEGQKRWPQVRNLAAFERAFRWPAGYLLRLAEEYTEHAEPAEHGLNGEDPNEDVIRRLPHITSRDREVFLAVYRARRRDAAQVAELLKQREYMQSLPETAGRDQVIANYDRQLRELAERGYESVTHAL